MYTLYLLYSGFVVWLVHFCLLVCVYVCVFFLVSSVLPSPALTVIWIKVLRLLTSLIYSFHPQFGLHEYKLSGGMASVAALSCGNNVFRNIQFHKALKFSFYLFSKDIKKLCYMAWQELTISKQPSNKSKI